MIAAWLRGVSDGIERADLGGWLPLLGGLGLIALTVLAPAYRDVQQARTQRARLNLEAVAHVEQLRRYEELIASVRRDDPIILQRLAWHELRLKPVGAEVLGGRPADRRPRAAYDQWVQPHRAAIASEPPLLPPDSLADRLVNGPRRPVLLVIGAALIGYGLFTSLRPRQA